MFYVKNTINFMRPRWIFMAMSATLVLISIFAIVTRGLNFGIQFTGGTVIEVHYSKSVPLSDVRSLLHKAGFPDAQVSNIGTARDVMIRVAPRAEKNRSKVGDKVVQLLSQDTTQKVTLRKVDFVGPTVGSELRQDGALALLYTVIAILIYVTLRFEWRFALGAVLALVHDIIITVGVFAITQLEFNMTVLAALLALLGYSLNDTIVVFDRVRENFRKMRKGSPAGIMNAAVTQTLSRTVITSFTVVLVLLSLFFFGGSVIHNFSLAMLIGVIFGTYSSVYVASALALTLGVSKADLMPTKKADVDDRP
ncbi:protein translocase subunit SecF [Acidihalobacter ferrooxydans]|uniref:Protein-export membrane protein SecF n=1 Tax=Acidihalobacter ferrooxydans TaxID=1765967 RepID=A0A1P8UH11_9GAMM|nr:protein translocase subunit SecF [Acidihalobacter ferrooxydans]APZ43054.1 protein-export membrane protein SecF [Acidihalobacter ferrooxydans]